MAIYTLSTSANYSAIKGSLANGDTIRIDTNAVRLTINEQPLLTNITVDSPGVSGRVTVSGAYDLSTWSMVAGTVTLIDGTFPAGAKLGSITGGSAASAHGIATNAGTITTSTGGSAVPAFGISTNDTAGVVTTANGGSATACHGISTNLGRVTSANGSTTFSSAAGVNSNSGFVDTATGGAFANSWGVFSNNNSIRKAIGGTAANGVSLQSGICLEAVDGTFFAIGSVLTGYKIINGPEYRTKTTTYTRVERIYSIGAVHPDATIPGAVPITILTEGSGGFSGIKGVDRNIGT